MNVSKQLQDAYDNQYQNGLSEWRNLGAKYKASNIIHVCQKIPTPWRVLEVGAGEGAILSHLETAEVLQESYALEISSSGIAAIESRGLKSLQEVKYFDGYTIPYENKSFDLVIRSHVLEHVEYPRKLLREMHRVGRFAVIEVPVDFSFEVDQKVDYFLSFGHINIYTPSLLRFLLTSEGFTVESDLMTLLSREVLEYNFYVNHKRKRGWKSIVRFTWQYWRKQISYLLAKEKGKQLLTDAYTVLCECEQEKQLEIMS